MKEIPVVDLQMWADSLAIWLSEAVGGMSKRTASAVYNQFDWPVLRRSFAVRQLMAKLKEKIDD